MIIAISGLIINKLVLFLLIRKRTIFMTQILIVVIPMVVLSLTMLLTIMWLMRSEQKRRQMELIMRDKANILPNRLQAYERIALFLERISPESLIIREQSHATNCLTFHSLLLKTVRTEYEHNVAMQIYLSPQAWKMVQTAREEVIKLINSTARETRPELPSIEMGKTILAAAPDACQYHIKRALEAIQMEVKQLG